MSSLKAEKSGRVNAPGKKWKLAGCPNLKVEDARKRRSVSKNLRQPLLGEINVLEGLVGAAGVG